MNGTTFTPGGRTCAFNSLTLAQCLAASSPARRPSAAGQCPKVNIVVVDNLVAFAVNRLAKLAQPDFRTLCYDRQIFDAQWRAVLGGDDGIRDVMHIAHQADRADVDLL